MKQLRRYVVTLKSDLLHLFWNSDKLFTLEEAKEYVAFMERMYPDNEGMYNIYRLVEVQE